MAVEWTYDGQRHQFVNAKTGKPLTQKQLVAVRDAFLTVRSEDAKALARRYVSGEIALGVWADLFARETALTHTALFQLGSGGNERMMQLDTWMQRLQTLLDYQRPFADKFISDVRAGLVSPAQMEERAALYMGAAVESYEQSHADEWGIDLPYYPGDGDTPCVTNCRCSWLVETVFEDEFEVTYATWITEGDNVVCEGCAERGQESRHIEVRRDRLTPEQVRNLNPEPWQGPGDNAGADDLIRRAVG